MQRIPLPLADVEPAPRSPGRPFALASAGLFMLSLCLPAFVAGPLLVGRGRDEATYGAVCLLYGWLVLPGWLANPLMGAAGIFYSLRKPRAAFVLTCLA